MAVVCSRLTRYVSARVARRVSRTLPGGADKRYAGAENGVTDISWNSNTTRFGILAYQIAHLVRRPTAARRIAARRRHRRCGRMLRLP